MQLTCTSKSFDFFGRLCLATTFAIAIPPKIVKFNSVLSSITNRGIPEPLAVVLLIGAIACLIFGIGFLLFSKDQRIGALLLLIFLVPTTLIMHFFPFQSLAVFMNIGLIGGLILVFTKEPPSGIPPNWSQKSIEAYVTKELKKSSESKASSWWVEIQAKSRLIELIAKSTQPLAKKGSKTNREVWFYLQQICAKK